MRQLALSFLGIVAATCIAIAISGHPDVRVAPSLTGTAPVLPVELATSTAATPTVPTVTSSPTFVSPVAADLWTRLGTLRASLHLAPYVLSPMLDAAASDQAQWMVSTGLVTHIRPDGSTPAQRALKAGYTENWSCSEIIYMGGIATLNDAWKFWLTSPIHYAELTSARHREAGIGIARSAAFGTAFVIVFGGFIQPTAVPPAASPPGYYVVQRGDTLYRIALRYGVPLDQLAAANHLRLTDLIFVGQVLIIPGLATAPSPMMAP